MELIVRTTTMAMISPCCLVNTGAGKSSFINAVAAALSEDSWNEFSYTADMGAGAPVTIVNQRYTTYTITAAAANTTTATTTTTTAVAAAAIVVAAATTTTTTTTSATAAATTTVNENSNCNDNSDDDVW